MFVVKFWKLIWTLLLKKNNYVCINTQIYYKHTEKKRVLKGPALKIL